jgi:hypothetical protein
MQAFQAAFMQQQQMRAHAGMHGIHNPVMNGMPSGAPFGPNPQGQIGPITTRVHETVGADGQRTRVVVNETTFQISRQSTPVPGTDRTEGSHGMEAQMQSTATSGPQLPPIGMQSHPHREPTPFPLPSSHLGERQVPLPPLPNFLPQPPTNEPTLPDLSGNTASTTTTAWLLSSPSGPQALVFAPGHGLFTTGQPTNQPTTRLQRPREGLRFQQAPSGHIRPQNNPNVPALPVVDPVLANGHLQPALDAVARAQNVAADAREPNALANNEILRTILNRVWTFIKLYFVIFMFTESGTWFRWICLFTAVFVAAMPSTTVFRGFTGRLQAQIDGLFPPPVAPAPPVRQHDEGHGQERRAAPNTGARRQGEPDPAATAARLVQEHRQRHPNVLRDTFERVERALGLFIASLIPGVGERHVRAREEARREIERVERGRVAAEEEQARKAEEEQKAKENQGAEEVGREVSEASGTAETKQQPGELSSAAAGVAGKAEKEGPVAEETLVEI